MWELDYDGALFLRIPIDSTSSFQSSGFYKLSLRRYVREVLPGFVRFKPALTLSLIHIYYTRKSTPTYTEGTKKETSFERG